MSATPQALPRIHIDARMISPIPHGFSRYVSRLVEGLARTLARQSVSYELVFLVNRQTPREIFGAFADSGLPREPELLELRAPFLNPLEILEIPGALARSRASLYHSPTFSAVLGLGCPSIVTIHDLYHWFHGSASQRFYYGWVLRRFALRSRALLTVSEFSKKEIAAWLPIPPEAIEVVPNALGEALVKPVPPAQLASALEKYGLKQGRYFLCLSNPKPHKNVPMLVEAHRRYSRMGQNGSTWPLVLSMSELPEGVAAHEGIRLIGGLDDERGTALLQACGAVCFPSLYEGFGLPPVEAVCAGLPLLVSDIPPHREGLAGVGPEECSWLNPRDGGAWATAMSQAASGALMRPTRESQSLLLHRYSIDRLGQTMDRIYRGVLGLAKNV